ncbi:unnamed protein product, partial [Anisakis simplex]|uniref:Spore protein n=1 Tax=Anisakis simplex TaxID=6269 RepID=A0A0M3JN79_ANISI
MKEKRRVHQKYLLNNNGNEADITAGKSQQSDVPAAVMDNEKNAEWNDDKMV